MFRGVPSFAPEILRRVKLADAMKAKKLREALQQMAEEGVVQVFLPHDGAAAIVGVVGALQLDVLTERLNAEYGLPVSFEPSRFEICRWVSSARQGGDREVPRRLPVLDRLRSRRRAGVHGVERLQPALRAGALAEDRFHRREGLSEGGGLNLCSLIQRGRSSTARQPRCQSANLTRLCVLRRSAALRKMSANRSPIRYQNCNLIRCGTRSRTVVPVVSIMLETRLPRQGGRFDRPGSCARVRQRRPSDTRRSNL